MTKLTKENLLKTCEVAALNAPYAAIMAKISASESLCYSWRARCVADRKMNRRDSIFLFEWRGETRWWDEHIAAARVEFIMGYEAELRHECRYGRTEVVLGPTQEPVLKLNPAYVGRDDDYIRLCEGDDCDPGYHRILRDDDGMPVPLTRQVFPAPAIRLRILEQDRRYLATQNIDMNVNARVVHTIAPPQRRPDEPRPNIPELKRIALLSPQARREELQASAFPKDAKTGLVIPADTGMPRGDDRSDHVKEQQKVAPPVNPRAYEAPLNPAAPRAAPSYAKPQETLARVRPSKDTEHDDEITANYYTA